MLLGYNNSFQSYHYDLYRTVNEQAALIKQFNSNIEYHISLTWISSRDNISLKECGLAGVRTHCHSIENQKSKITSPTALCRPTELSSTHGLLGQNNIRDSLWDCKNLSPIYGDLGPNKRCKNKCIFTLNLVAAELYSPTALYFNKTCFFFVYLIIYVPSTIFQLCRDGSSWVEPVLS